MLVPVMIRGFRPRPWKNKAGEQRYSGTFVVLDMSDRPIMETVEVERDFQSDGDLVKAAQLIGKQATLVVEGLKVGQDGKARLVGQIEAAK